MTRYFHHFLLAAITLASAGIANAQPQNFSTRFVPIQSAPPNNPAENRCQVRVWVDDVATVYFRNELIGITTQSGRAARDEGTSCSGPLPAGPVSEFRILSANRRNAITNVIAPQRSNEFTGAVTLQDPQQGGSIYEFEVAWIDARAADARRFAYATPFRGERVVRTEASPQNFSTRFVPIQSAPPANPAENRCQVRVWVDDTATVYFRNELIGITTQSGRAARDEGTSCSGPLPAGPVSEFRILRANRTNAITNVIAPSRSNEFTGAVSLRDPQQGGSIYEFEIAWVDARAADARRFAYTTPYRVDRDRDGRRDAPDDGNFAAGEETEACQRSVVNSIRARNNDRNIDVEFRANVAREDVGGPRVKIRGNGRANSRSDSSRIVYECVVNDRNNRVISTAYDVRNGDLR